MKKLSFLFAALVISVMTFAETASVTLADGKFDTDHITWMAVNGNITITQLKGSSSSDVNKNYISAPRVYKGHILSFVCKENYTITGIDITYSGSYYGNNITAGIVTTTTAVTDNTTAIARSISTSTGGTHSFTTTNTAGESAIYIQNEASKSNVQLRPTAISITYIKAATTEPSITCTDVDFGTVITGVAESKELTVVGENLTEAITATLTTGTNFTVTGTLTAEGGTLTIGVNATAEGAVSDKLTLTSGSTTKEVTLSATAVTVSGEGTKENPFTVADVVKLGNPGKLAWVAGYMVGSVSGNGATATITSEYSATNVALSDATTAAASETFIPVQLSSGTTPQTKLNLKDNAALLSHKVYLYGSLENYFTREGLKSVTDYVLFYDVVAAANDNTMGTITGEGTYAENTEVTLKATAETGYEFVNWTDADDKVVSTDAAYTFTVTADVLLQANFQAETPVVKLFTIEKLWESVDIPAAANCKQGAGWDGVVYVQDKTDGASKVYAITKDGKTEYASSGVGQGMAIDDAGNMIVRDAYFAAAAPGSFLIYKKGETTGKQVTFTLNPTGRTDFNSASGNIFSAEGGYVYFYCSAATTISYVKITNGAATAEDVTVGTIGTGWTAGSSVGHVMRDRDGNIVAQPRSAAWQKWDVTAEKFVTFSLPQVKNSTLGGCTFELGGKEFWAYNITGTNYNSEWNLYNMTDAEFVSETTLYVKDKTTTGTAYANWLNAQKIDEKTVYIYQFCPNVGAAVWKVNFNSTTPTPTEIEDITPSEVVAPKATKVFRNGQVLILVGDKTYNVMGQVIE